MAVIKSFSQLNYVKLYKKEVFRSPRQPSAPENALQVYQSQASCAMECPQISRPRSSLKPSAKCFFSLPPSVVFNQPCLKVPKPFPMGFSEGLPVLFCFSRFFSAQSLFVICKLVLPLSLPAAEKFYISLFPGNCELCVFQPSPKPAILPPNPPKPQPATYPCCPIQ
ncbi:hypothetical protein TNIN_284541 [Trichonephila inaurata madagascariensis]|uniref:Uncharacterized protein n=1 Tax=Trichonephila inaurata madagascariensis TaxID=2747483 RepID=A0A8X6WQ69_9ARAC|nr:hypothetical protein TNIN_284541 [Trichonephila inaurata madagascariensis]